MTAQPPATMPWWQSVGAIARLFPRVVEQALGGVMVARSLAGAEIAAW
jgi:hypothetical protein